MPRMRSLDDGETRTKARDTRREVRVATYVYVHSTRLPTYNDVVSYHSTYLLAVIKIKRIKLTNG